MKKVRQILVLLICVVSTLMSGCQKDTLDSNEQTVVSIDGQVISLKEMMYHVVIAEFQGKLISSYFGNEANYWSSEYEKGVTMSAAIKDKVMADAIKYEIFYRKALEEGLELSEEEKTAAREKAVNMKQNIAEDALNLVKLNEEDLIHIGEKLALSTKAYQEFVKSLGADEESIKSHMDPNDYIEYKIEYLFIPTMKQAESGALIPLGEEEKQAAYDKLYTYEVQAKEGNEFKSIKINPEDNIKVGEIRFAENKNEFADEIEIPQMASQLAKNQVSDIFETSRGYYIIKRLGDPYTTLYDEAVSAEVKEKEETIVIPAYEKFKKDYDIKINKKVWEKIEIGQMTTK